MTNQTESFVTFVPSWLYSVRSGTRAGIFAVALAVLTSCASAPPSPAKIAEFSQAWKTAGPGERGYLVRIDLVREHLAGKEQAEVLEFLGSPDGDEGRAFVYRLGWTPEGRNWYLKVSFDAEGRVDGVYGDK
jgi:hypothetical protein